MKVIPNAVVTIRIEFSMEGTEPQPPHTMTFIYGQERLLFDLDRQLEGLAPEEAATLNLQPFGEHRPDLIMDLLADRLFDPPQADPGQWCECRTREGEEIAFRLLGREGDLLRCDFNHPRAGRTMQVTASVLDVRAATPEELAAATQRCSSG